MESFKALFRQRHRWAWGTLQVFLEYAVSGKTLLAPIGLGRRLDLFYYLTFWMVPFVVLSSFLLPLLEVAGVIDITNSFGLTFLLANSFSFVPMMVLGLAWAKIPPHKILYLVPLAAAYTYHWIPALILGWGSILTHRKPHWVKTERYGLEEPAK